MAQCFQCHRHFSTITSLTQHMEDSSCGPGAHGIHCAVSSMDSRGMFTNRMISNGENENTGGSIFPAGSVIATEESWNGHSFECGLCHRCYPKLSYLNKHLKDTTHKEQLYRCSHCRRTFNKASSLVSHIESQSCGTPVTLKQQMQYLLSGVSQISNGSDVDYGRAGREESDRVVAEVIRSVAFSHSLTERRNTSNKTIFLSNDDDGVKFDVYYSTGTVRVTMDHPRMGPNSLHRTDVFNPSEVFSDPGRVRAQLTTIFCDPRYHSDKGYRDTRDSLRRCIQCNSDEPRENYSSNQWRKGSGASRCRYCV